MAVDAKSYQVFHRVNSSVDVMDFHTRLFAATYSTLSVIALKNGFEKTTKDIATSVAYCPFRYLGKMVFAISLAFNDGMRTETANVVVAAVFAKYALLLASFLQMLFAKPFRVWCKRRAAFTANTILGALGVTFDCIASRSFKAMFAGQIALRWLATTLASSSETVNGFGYAM